MSLASLGSRLRCRSSCFPRLVALLHSSLASLVARRSSFGFLAASSSRYEGARSSPYSLLVFCLSRCSSLGLTVIHRSVARLGRLRRRSSVVRLSLGPRLACLVRRPSLLARRSSLVALRWSRCFSARAARIFSPLALALRRTAAFQLKPFPFADRAFRMSTSPRNHIVSSEIRHSKRRYMQQMPACCARSQVLLHLQPPVVPPSPKL